MRFICTVSGCLLLTLLFCPVPVRSQDTTNRRTLGDLHIFDSQFEGQFERLQHDRPAEDSFDVTTLPRYKDLRNRASSLVERDRLTFLYDGPRIVQRVTATTVLAGEVHGLASVLKPCYDFCKYVGMVIVHLRQPTLDPFVKGQIYLHYDGLKTYTTVSGAAETVPKFREVDLQTDFPVLWKTLRGLESFSANGAEWSEFIEPQMAKQALELAEWKLRVIRSELEFLTERRNLVDQFITDKNARAELDYRWTQQIGPNDFCIYAVSGWMQRCREVIPGCTSPCNGWVKACANGSPCPPFTLSPEQSKELSTTKSHYDDVTSTLLEKLKVAETDLADSIQSKSVAWGVLGWRGHMDEFTRAWIQLNSGSYISASDSRNLHRIGGVDLMSGCQDMDWDKSSYITAARELQGLTNELSCWSSRYETPPGTRAEGRVLEPTWWQDYLNSSRSQRAQ